MKKIYFIFLILLSVSAFGENKILTDNYLNNTSETNANTAVFTSSDNVFEGDITVATQAEIDALPAEQ